MLYLEKSYFKLALTAGIKAAKIFSKHNDVLGYARATYNNACVLESLDRDNEAISNYQEIITTFEEHEDYYNLALTYQGLGMSYSKLKQNKNDAISNFKKSIDYAKKLNDSVLIATSLNELGKLHLTYNELDIAENLLNESYVISTKIDSKFSKHIAAIDIGDLYHLKKEYAQSIKYYKEGISLSTEIGVLLGMSNANKGLYTVYKSLNKPSEALKCHEIYMTLHDSIYNINQTEKINELQIQYETQKKEAEIAFQQQEIKNLNQEVEIINLRKGLYAGGMFTFLVVSGLLLFSFKQRIKKNRIAHEKQEEIYKQEIEFKKKELASQTLHLVQKNTFIQELRENLEKIKKSPELFKVEFRRLVMLLKKESAEDKDWEVFKSYFSEVHNNFDNKLKEVSIDISEKEIRLASFLRMNLSTKEIASMLNVLPESVLKSKYRLKKKLDLDKETDLNQFLNSL